MLFALVSISAFGLMKNLSTLHNPSVINGKYQHPQAKDGCDQEAPLELEDK